LEPFHHCSAKNFLLHASRAPFSFTANLVNERKSMNWLYFALLTVASWGVYGIFLHIGSTGMNDKVNGRYMSFLYVGIAYFLVAIIGPIVMLKMQNGRLDFWNYPPNGLWWSLIAGIVGAVGAFGVLLAFGAAPNPKPAYVPVIMSIIFAGAPIVNAIVSICIHPPTGGLGTIKWPFWVGILLAACGAALVTKFKPDAAPAPAKTSSTTPAQPR
jgi:uncharacterized membrane protein YeaQ/YmgE (transglycosylase-associated protein family)